MVGVVWKDQGEKGDTADHKGQIRTAWQAHGGEVPTERHKGGADAAMEGLECQAKQQTLLQRHGDTKKSLTSNDLIRFIHLQVHSGFCVDEARKSGQSLLIEVKDGNQEASNESSCL